MTITPASVLRIAEAIPETAENYPILRDLKSAPQKLVTLAKEQS